MKKHNNFILNQNSAHVTTMCSFRFQGFITHNILTSIYIIISNKLINNKGNMKCPTISVGSIINGWIGYWVLCMYQNVQLFFRCLLCFPFYIRYCWNMFAHALFFLVDMIQANKLSQSCLACEPQGLRFLVLCLSYGNQESFSFLHPLVRLLEWIKTVLVWILSHGFRLKHKLKISKMLAILR